jgi:phosphoribosylamine--glycine ligase
MLFKNLLWLEDDMDVLVVGSGGREHAMCFQFSKSSRVKKIYCAPGNAGTSQVAKNVNILENDFDKLAAFAKANSVDFTFVGPEIPLSLGIVDYFQSEGLKVIGPSKTVARLESSKIYSKEFMRKYSIPTARYKSFEDVNEALKFLESLDLRKKIVIKANGLAAGKGVYICNEKEEAKKIVRQLMSDKILGDAGASVLIEEYMDGQELSYLIFTDGISYSVMPPSQDHKRLNDGDNGPNTGGMGAYAPAPLGTDELNKRVEDMIIRRVVYGIKSENFDYRGILYVGIVVCDFIPYVLEFNCRFGDPETQVILPLLDTDLTDICVAILSKNLSSINVEWKKKFSVCVVISSGGYPGKFKKNFEIEGIRRISDKNTVVFHAGTKLKSGKYFTSGGRVLGVTSVADNIKDAVCKVYESVSLVCFKNMHYRKDIAWRALDGR